MLIACCKFENGAIGSLEATRNAYGRNNFITFEIHGTKGSIPSTTSGATSCR